MQGILRGRHEEDELVDEARDGNRYGLAGEVLERRVETRAAGPLKYFTDRLWTPGESAIVPDFVSAPCVFARSLSTTSVPSTKTPEPSSDSVEKTHVRGAFRSNEVSNVIERNSPGQTPMSSVETICSDNSFPSHVVPSRQVIRMPREACCPTRAGGFRRSGTRSAPRRVPAPPASRSRTRDPRGARAPSRPRGRRL